MSREQGGFLLLFILADLLIVMGIQGNLGVLIAILFSPSHVQIEDGAA